MKVREFVDQLIGHKDTDSRYIDWAIDLARERLKPEDFTEFMAAELIETEVVSIAEWLSLWCQLRLQSICTDALYARTIRETHLAHSFLYRQARGLGIEVARTDIDLPLTLTEALLIDRQNIL